MACQWWTTRVGSSPTSQGSSSWTAVAHVCARPSRIGSPSPTMPASVWTLRKSQRGLTRKVSSFVTRSSLFSNRPAGSKGGDPGELIGAFYPGGGGALDGGVPVDGPGPGGPLSAFSPCSVSIAGAPPSSAQRLAVSPVHIDPCFW